MYFHLSSTLHRGSGQSALLLSVFFAVLLGAALTVASWVVIGLPTCSEQTSTLRAPCTSVSLARGFPQPWIVEHGIPAGPSQPSGPIYWLVEYVGLGIDLAVWSWLSLVAVLVVKRKGEEGNAPIPLDLPSVGVLIGLGSVMVGLILAWLVAGSLRIGTLLGGDYVSRSSLSLLSYCVMVLGVGITLASHRRSRAAVWLSCLAAGFLITFATMFIPSWFEFLSLYVLAPTQGYAGFGLPISWMIVVQNGPSGVEAWAFVIDALIWASIVASLVVLISALQSNLQIASASIATWVAASMVVGVLLTMSSWFVWMGLSCGDTLKCAFPTVGRGFPIPWIRVFNLPDIAPYHGGFESQILYGGLVFDLLVWSWFSFVTILPTGLRKVEIAKPHSLRHLLPDLLPSLSAILVGLIVVSIVAPPRSGFIPVNPHSLPFLGFSITVFGTALLMVTFRNGRLPNWMSWLSLAVLITLATFPIGQLPTVQPQIADLTQHGFPFVWLTIGTSTVLRTEDFLAYLSFVTEWAFILDVLVWSSILAAGLLVKRKRSLGLSVGRQASANERIGDCSGVRFD
jgi:hypothetical protein